MKMLAYVANIILLFAMAMLAYNNAKGGWGGLWAIIAIGIVPIISIVGLFKADRGGDIISLYLQRKRLEQEKKIYDLKESMQSK